MAKGKGRLVMTCSGRPLGARDSGQRWAFQCKGIRGIPWKRRREVYGPEGLWEQELSGWAAFLLRKEGARAKLKENLSPSPLPSWGRALQDYQGHQEATVRVRIQPWPPAG